MSGEKPLAKKIPSPFMLHKLPSWARSQGTAAPCQPSLAHRRLFRLQRATHHLLSPRAYRCSETIHGIIYVMKLLLASSLPGTFSSSFPSSASSYFYGILASPQGMLAEPLPRASLFRILHETTPKTLKSHTSTWTSIHTHTHPSTELTLPSAQSGLNDYKTHNLGKSLQP